jgi:ectoine hydroxylase-related dioxygenase (phytanoyl-CoA dioxygenase family)
VVAAVLGDDAEHSFSGIVFSDPNTPAQCWHTDSPHVAVEHRPAHAVNVLVALHDIPMEMGPTEFARGSQVLTNHLQNPSLVRDELIYQHAATTPQVLVTGSKTPAPEAFASALESGTCVVFDDRILHRGLANRSGKTRYVGYFSYRCRGYADNTHFEAVRSVFDKAS